MARRDPLVLHRRRRSGEAQVPVLLLGHLDLVRPLGLAGIPVLLGVTDPGDLALRSRYVLGHTVHQGFGGGEAGAGTLARLLSVGEVAERLFGERVPLFHGDGEALAYIRRHRRALAPHYRFVLVDDALAEAMADQLAWAELCAAHGVPSPRTLPGSRSAEAGDVLGFPVIVKPRRSVDRAALPAGVFDRAGLVFAGAAPLAEHPLVKWRAQALVIQQYIPGDETRSFHGFSSDRGELLASFCGRRLRARPGTGESSFIELWKDPAVAAAGRELAERLGCRGPFKIDLKRDARDGRHHALVEGRPEVAPAQQPDYGTRHRWLDVSVDVHAFKELRGLGKLDTRGWLRSLLSHRLVYSTFAWRDPRPWAHWLSGVLLHALLPVKA
jgi:predicted ATP-grasp superfamily ATP-dependent carboligase